MDVGIDGKEGTDRFKVYVCNERGFLESLHKIHSLYAFASFNYILVFKEFNEEFIVSQVTGRIEKIRGKSWEEITAQLSTFLEYEFSPNTPDYE